MNDDWYGAISALVTGSAPWIFEFFVVRPRNRDVNVLAEGFEFDLVTLLGSSRFPPGNKAMVRQAARNLLERSEPRTLWQLALIGVPAMVLTALRPAMQEDYYVGNGFVLPSATLACVFVVISVWAFLDRKLIQYIVAEPNPPLKYTPQDLARCNLAKLVYKALRWFVLLIALLSVVEAFAYAFLAPS